MLWYKRYLETFDEVVHDAVCVRCELYMGKCKCDYEMGGPACCEKTRHDDLSFIVEAANRLLYKA